MEHHHDWLQRTELKAYVEVTTEDFDLLQPKSQAKTLQF